MVTFYKDTHEWTANIEIKRVKYEFEILKLGQRVSGLVYIAAHRRGVVEVS